MKFKKLFSLSCYNPYNKPLGLLINCILKCSVFLHRFLDIGLIDIAVNLNVNVLHSVNCVINPFAFDSVNYVYRVLTSLLKRKFPGLLSISSKQ